MIVNSTEPPEEESVLASGVKAVTFVVLSITVMVMVLEAMPPPSAVTVYVPTEGMVSTPFSSIDAPSSAQDHVRGGIGVQSAPYWSL